MEHGEVRGHKLSKKQRGLFGAIAGGAKLRKFHKSPDEYNDTALGETPPRTHYTRNPDVGSDSHSRAVGQPAGVRVADGTENLRGDSQTRDAGISRAGPSSSPKRTPGGVRSCRDGEV